MANRPAEIDELNRRYDAARQLGQSRNADQVLAQFEQACGQSRAILCCDMERKLLPIAKRHQDLFANFYDLLELRFSDPPRAGHPDWRVRRAQVEIELLGGSDDHRRLHYGSLTMDGRGLPHYGNCEVLLREHMVAHRCSIFQENSALYFHQFGTVLAGYRSTWSNRSRLCVAKLAGKITSGSQSSGFPGLLQKAGTGQGLDDEFVEVQVFGDLTFHAFERIVYRSPGPSAAKASKRKKRGSTAVKARRDYCRKSITQGIPVEFVEA